MCSGISINTGGLDFDVYLAVVVAKGKSSDVLIVINEEVLSVDVLNLKFGQGQRAVIKIFDFDIFIAA